MANLRELVAYAIAGLSLALVFVFFVQHYAVYLTAKISLTITLMYYNILMGFATSLLAYCVYKDNKKLKELSDRCKRLEQQKESEN